MGDFFKRVQILNFHKVKVFFNSEKWKNHIVNAYLWTILRPNLKKSCLMKLIKVKLGHLCYAQATVQCEPIKVAQSKR